MALALDHLVVAARTLEEGVAWVESRLGIAMGPGGKHAAMGTHNRLLSRRRCPVEARDSPRGISARIRTPAGRVPLGE